MLILPEVEIVFMYPRPINMNWGEVKLTALCLDELGIDPKTGAVFLFFNRRRDSLKLFFYSDDGCQEILKVLDGGSFTLPEPDVRDKFVKIPGHTIRRIFRTTDPSFPDPVPGGKPATVTGIIRGFLDS